MGAGGTILPVESEQHGVARIDTSVRSCGRRCGGGASCSDDGNGTNINIYTNSTSAAANPTARMITDCTPRHAADVLGCGATVAVVGSVVVATGAVVVAVGVLDTATAVQYLKPTLCNEDAVICVNIMATEAADAVVWTAKAMLTPD